ncbi:MAG: helix-turn-helix domain-containing protein [Desulfobacterales bacterium]
MTSKPLFLSKSGAMTDNQSRRADFDLLPAPNTIVNAVCEAFKCDRESILAKGRKENIARDIASYLSRDLTGKSNVFLGEFFGGISGAGITMRCNHVTQKLKASRRFRANVNRIKKQIINS